MIPQFCARHDPAGATRWGEHHESVMEIMGKGQGDDEGADRHTVLTRPLELR